jgi:hypothetical protein
MLRHEGQQRTTTAEADALDWRELIETGHDERRAERQRRPDGAVGWRKSCGEVAAELDEEIDGEARSRPDQSRLDLAAPNQRLFVLPDLGDPICNASNAC